LKKILWLLPLCVLILAGCTTANDSQPQPEQVDVPTTASPPNTMTVDEILLAVNTLLDFSEGLEFSKQHVEFMHEDDDEVIYIFNKIHIEVGIFADRETDAFLYAYFRLYGRTPDAHIYMASVAGAFLTALEPNEAENMVIEVISVDDSEGGVTLWDPENFETRASYGEYWVLVNHGSIMNILPRTDLDE